MNHIATAEPRQKEPNSSAPSYSALQTGQFDGISAGYPGQPWRSFAAASPLAPPLRHSLPALMRSPISGGLIVNDPGDPFEQEADGIADQVMRMADPVKAQRSCAACEKDERLQRKCAGCEEEEEKNKVQRKEAGAGPNVATPIVHEVLNSPGHPLDSETRAFFEPRFGHDFSRVRVHADERAAESAAAVSALAFTHGSHIVFGATQYAPDSDRGRHLLAHELTHVLHQGCGMRAIQRQPTPVDVGATATEVEHLVRPGNDEKGALDKLKALDMADLLKVVEKIRDDFNPTETDEGKRLSYTILNDDLEPPVSGGPQNPAIQNLTELERARLKSAFDAAPARKLRNPMGQGSPGTRPTLSDYRKRPDTATRAARPGDWGDDPAGNTWIAHAEGIRTYFASTAPKRSSAWLAKNPGNADYVKEKTPRAIGSFHWGKGVHDFAIYFNEDDASADLKANVGPFQSIGGYVKVHLGNNPQDNNEGPDVYIKNMRKAVAVTENDSPAMWTNDDNKWNSLIRGFKAAEGWLPGTEGTTVTTANINSLSSDPKDAALIAYYQTLLGSKTGP